MSRVTFADSEAELEVAFTPNGNLEVGLEDDYDDLGATLSGDSLAALRAGVNAAADNERVEASIEDDYGNVVTLYSSGYGLDLTVYSEGDSVVIGLDAEDVNKLAAVINGQNEPAQVPVGITGAIPSLVDPGREAFNAAVIEAAADNDVAIRFRYSKSDHDPVETRTLEGVSLVVTGKGKLVVVGDDPDREDTRSFRVDRIKGYVNAAD